MPVIGKAVVGGGGKGFDLAERVEETLRKKGHLIQRLKADVRRRSYTHAVKVGATTITLTYNSTLPGYATMRYPLGKVGGDVISRVILIEARKVGLSITRLNALRRKLKG